MMKHICTLTDKVILNRDGLSNALPRLTARAIVRNNHGLYAVMYAEKWNLYSLPGGGIEDGEDVETALRREIFEETGCSCDIIQELGIVSENRASLDYTQINHYFIVSVSTPPCRNHLTDAEQACGTQVQWHSFEKMQNLICNQHFDRIQGKYLQARDLAALNAYLTQFTE